MNASSIRLAIGLVFFTASRVLGVSFSDYEGAAIQEAGVVNTNRSTGLNPFASSSVDIGSLNKGRFGQVSLAIAEIGRHPSFKGDADRLSDWLTRGFILVDGTLDSGTSAETRRDGSSKPALAPDWGPVGSDKVCFEGNIFLNAGKEHLFFPPAGLESKKAVAARLAGKKRAGEKLSGSELQILEHLRQLMDGGLSFLFLQSILVHEATHTQQRWGGQASKESEAYVRQLEYLKALIPAASREDAARLEILIKQVEKDMSEQTR